MLRPVRRVVTGHDDHGRAVILSDSVSPHTKEAALQPGRGLTDLWRTFSTPADNRGDVDNADTEVVLTPPTNGSVFRFFQVIPESQGGGSHEEQQRIASAAFAGMGADHNRDPDARHPNMHQTETTDYIIVLEGEVTMLVDEGEVHLQPMDVVVQRGTNHAWVNHGSEPAILAAILIDASSLSAEFG
ncbi:MAG: cupin domain-containing protein [Pseudomonadota bacterium]